MAPTHLFAVPGPPRPAAPVPSPAPRAPRSRGPRRGFTMLEMIVALTMIAITAAMAVPHVHALVTRQRVDRTAQVVAADVRTAFTSAARGRVPVRLAVSAGGRSYTITNYVTGDVIVRRTVAVGDLSAAAFSANPATLDFYPNGTASGVDTITVGGAEYSRRVSVSRVGFVRVLP